MILDGGLGNQLFMWAAAFALSRRIGTDCEFELRKRHYGIEFMVPSNLLPIKTPVLSRAEARFLQINMFVRNRLVEYLPKDYRRKYNLRTTSSRFYVEEGSTFNESFCSISAGKFLLGYYHSWKYFESQREQIRNTLKLQELQREFLEEYPELANGNYLAMHIRRGDYLKEYADYFGLCGESYYKAAYELAKKLWSFQRIVVFTDEEIEARKVFSSADLYISPRNQKSGAIDLVGMGIGRGIICANSTFSWWAAYLHKDPSISAIFPYPWYKDGAKNTKDLIHPNWIQIGKGDY